MPHLSADDKEFEAEQDVRTMLSAAKIKADKPRLKRAMARAKAQMKALEKVQT